jgi:hypothetical protein
MKRGGKVKQEKRVLLLALYILKKKHGFASVRKRHALSFIKGKQLMKIPEDERAMRSDYDEIWENDIARKRQDLVDSGHLEKMRDVDAWQISEKGVSEVEDWAQRVRAYTQTKVDWRRDLEAMPEDDIYLSPEAVEWLMKIATGTL